MRVASRPGFGAGESWSADRRLRRPDPPVGQSAVIDAATGEVLNSYNTEDEPNRRLLVACRNRRASRCPLRGAVPGRHLPAHPGRSGRRQKRPRHRGRPPRVFATLTAPSFGPVHHRVVNPDRSVQRCHPGAGCNRRHDADDPCLGQAVSLTATTTTAP